MIDDGMEQMPCHLVSKRLSSTPYAILPSACGGKFADGHLLLGGNKEHVQILAAGQFWSLLNIPAPLNRE